MPGFTDLNVGDYADLVYHSGTKEKWAAPMSRSTPLIYMIPGDNAREVIFARRAAEGPHRPAPRGVPATGSVLAWPVYRDRPWKGVSTTVAAMFRLEDPVQAGAMLVDRRGSSGDIEAAVHAAYQEALTVIDAGHGLFLPEPGRIEAITAYAGTLMAEDQVRSLLASAIHDLLQDRKAISRSVCLPLPWDAPFRVRLYRPGMSKSIFGAVEMFNGYEAESDRKLAVEQWDMVWHGRPASLTNYAHYGEWAPHVLPLLREIALRDDPDCFAETALDRAAAEQRAYWGDAMSDAIAEVATALEDHGDDAVENGLVGCGR